MIGATVPQAVRRAVEAATTARAVATEATTRLRVRARHAAYRFQYGPGAPEPYRPITVDPATVDYLLTPRFYDEWLGRRGTYVVGGRWDRRFRSETGPYPSTTALDYDRPTLARYDDYLLHRSIRAHFRDDVPWEETRIYDYRRSVDRYGTPAAVLSDLRRTDDLYRSIRRNGYQRQATLGVDGPGDAPPAFHEVRVNVGRDGGIVFDDGRHRFSVAKLLGLSSIPVRVMARHPRWQRLRTEIATTTDRAALSDAACHHLDHPDVARFVPSDNTRS